MKKTQLLIAAGLTLASISVQADLANYQSTVSGQSPAYYFNFDNSLNSAGNTATFAANGGATFGGDYFGNANDAALFPASSDYLSLASPTVINGAGTTTAVGSMSLLFYVPATIPTTGYYFSDSEQTAGSIANGQAADSAFALQFSSSALTFKIGNKSTTLPAVTADTWYYMAVTYSFTGASASDACNYYIGSVGGTLSTASISVTASASTVGDGLAFVVGNKQAAVTASSTAGVAGGEIDELATWNTVLTSGQIASQYSALQPVPEPSTLAVIGLGGMLLLLARRVRDLEY